MPSSKRYKRHKTKVARKINKLDLIVLILNIIACLALLLSYLAPSTDPRDYSLIALLGLIYPILVVINLVFPFFWLFSRKKWYALFSFAAILVGINYLGDYWGFHGNSNYNKPKDAIRIFTLNVNEFLGVGTREGIPTQNNIFQLIKDKNADILCLQEFVDRGSIADSLKRFLKGSAYLYRYSGLVRDSMKTAQQSFDFSQDSLRICIFSRYPIIDSGSISNKRLLELFGIYADLKVENKIIRVYTAHLKGVHFKKGQRHGHSMSGVSATRFVSALNQSFDNKSYQIDLIKQHAGKCKYPYIFAGDIDDTPLSFSVNSLSQNLRNAFREKGSGYGSTYTGGIFPLQIDYIFTTNQFDILNYEIIDKKVSDHKPIISDLRLN